MIGGLRQHDPFFVPPDEFLQNFVSGIPFEPSALAAGVRKLARARFTQRRKQLAKIVRRSTCVVIARSSPLAVRLRDPHFARRGSSQTRVSD
jgi:hypothetical protein